MRLALWTFCLIFSQTAYSSDTYMKVTNFKNDELQDHHHAVQNTHDEESMIYNEQVLSNLHKSMKENFDRIGNVVDSERYFTTTTEKRTIRHKKHSRNYHQYHSQDNYENEVRNTEDKDLWARGFTNEKLAHFSTDVEQNDAPLSPVSQSKLESLGTEEKVKERFQSTYNTLPVSISNIKYQEGIRKAASDHFEDMKKRTVCKSPIPKIVKVDQVYPNVLKDYYPPCTIIHQCSDESGCCPTKKARCSPSAFQNVTLYFRVATRMLNGDYKQAFEGLQFINHTDCKCVVEPDTRKARDTSFYAQLSSTESTPKPQKLSYIKKCLLPCPFPFSHRITADGTCVCECVDQNRECLKHKQGEVYFSLKDSHCLFTKTCMYPSCTYGNYLKRVGRCPNHKERRILH